MSESNAKKLFEKGITYFSNKEFILAQEYFVKALELSPNRISILENLATVYYLNGNYLQAEIILGRMDKLDHSSSKIFDLMIKVLKKLGKIKELKLYIIKELEKKKKDLKYKGYFFSYKVLPNETCATTSTNIKKYHNIISCSSPKIANIFEFEDYLKKTIK